MPVLYTGLNVLGIDLKLIEMPSHRLLQQPVLVILQYIGFMSDGNALRVEQCLGYGMRGGCKHVSTEKSTPPSHHLCAATIRSHPNRLQI